LPHGNDGRSRWSLKSPRMASALDILFALVVLAKQNQIQFAVRSIPRKLTLFIG